MLQRKLPTVIRKIAADPLVWICLALVVVYLVVVSLRPAGYFWTIDEGGKLTYLQSTLKTGDPAAPLVYPLRAYDPDAQFVPLYFRAPIAAQFYSWWAVNFPLVTAPFYLAAGWLGLYILPALFGGICALFAGLITRLLVPGRRRLGWLAAIITGAATPVAFYSTMYWEHTLAVGFGLGSLYFILLGSQKKSSGYLIAAGILGSLGTWFRVEIAVFLFGAGLALLIIQWRPALTYAAAFCASAVPWLAFNYLVTGSLVSNSSAAATSSTPAFASLGLNFVPDFLFNVPNFSAYVFDRNTLILGTLLVALGIVAPFIRRLRWLAVVSYVGLLAITIPVLFSPTEYRSLHGFFLAAPAILFGAWLFAGYRPAKNRLFPWLVLGGSLVFALVYVLRAWTAAGGLQYGPRYLLIFYPLLIAAGLAGLAGAWAEIGRALRIALVICYTAFVLAGAGLEFRGMQTEKAFVELVPPAANEIKALSASKPVVTRYCEITMLDTSLYWGAQVFSITRSDLNGWAAQAQKVGIDSFFLVDIDLCGDKTLKQIADEQKIRPGGLTVQTCSAKAILAGEPSACS